MYLKTVSNLMHNTEVNKRGVCSVIGVPKSGVASMPDFKATMLSITTGTAHFYAEQIILKAGFAWKSILADYNINIVFNEEDKSGVQGEQYDYELRVPFANDTFTLSQIVREYKEQEWILLVKERTGAWRLIGDLDRGATFGSNFSTGTVRKEANKYEAGFRWQVGARRAFYIEAFEPEMWLEFKGTNISEYFQLEIDEPVLVEWGDGTSSIYMANIGVNRTVYKQVLASTFTYRVYHKGKARKLNCSLNVSGSNGNITEINGTLPAAIVDFQAEQNLLTAIPLINNTPALNVVRLNNNQLSAVQVTNVLNSLDNFGLSNGAITIDQQSPAAVPTGPYKANLISKGWSVVTD